MSSKKSFKPTKTKHKIKFRKKKVINDKSIAKDESSNIQSDVPTTKSIDFSSKVKGKSIHKGNSMSKSTATNLISKQKTKIKRKKNDDTSKVKEESRIVKEDRPMASDKKTIRQQTSSNANIKTLVSKQNDSALLSKDNYGKSVDQSSFSGTQNTSVSISNSLPNLASTNDVSSKSLGGSTLETSNNARSSKASKTSALRVAASLLTAAGHLKEKENQEQAKLRNKSIRTMLKEEKGSIYYRRLEDFDPPVIKAAGTFEPFLVENFILQNKISPEELNKLITIEPAIIANTVGG